MPGNNKLVIGVGTLIVVAIVVGLIVWLIGGGEGSPADQVRTPLLR